MGRFGRVVPTLLLHVNLLLMLFAGAILSTAARLKWDPSAYVATRELFPLEYRWAAGVFPTVAFALVLLAHLALFTLRCRQVSTRRVLLMVYAVAMLMLVWGETVWSGWVVWRVRRWMRGGEAAELRHALAIKDDLHPLLQHLSHYHPLPEKVDQLMAEVEADLPRNLYVMASASCILVTLQVVAAALAVIAANNVRPRRRRRRAPSDPLSYSDVTTTTPLRYGLEARQYRQNSSASSVQKWTSRDGVTLAVRVHADPGADGVVDWVLTISRRNVNLVYGPTVDIVTYKLIVKKSNTD